MIARQHAEPTGINRQSLMKTELHGKIGDRSPVQLRMDLTCPCFRLVYIGIKIIEYVIVERHIRLILGSLTQTRASDLAQEQDRVMSKSIPEIRIQAAEYTRCLWFPGPPQVISQFTQARKALR